MLSSEQPEPSSYSPDPLHVRRRQKAWLTCTNVPRTIPQKLGPRPPHNPKVVGSNPTPATKKHAGQGRCESAGPFRSRTSRANGQPQPVCGVVALLIVALDEQQPLDAPPYQAIIPHGKSIARWSPVGAVMTPSPGSSLVRLGQSQHPLPGRERSSDDQVAFGKCP